MERFRVFGELVRFTWRERNWWLMPLVLTLVVVGGLVFVVSASPIAPFLYPLF